MTTTTPTISPMWKWSVCGVLFLATMLNYMDRQTLSQTSPRLLPELNLSKTQYGTLELGFGLAFAAGGLCFGFLADRLKIYFLFPLVILCWSAIGFATAFSVEIGGWLGAESESGQAFRGLLACRIALGFFEAAQWPFALVTTSRLLSRAERSLGNSILQSGTAIGSIATPIVVQMLVTDEPGTWRRPFMVIGMIGVSWLIPWFVLMRPGDLSKPAPPPVDAPAQVPDTSLARAIQSDRTTLREGSPPPIALDSPADQIPGGVLMSRIICCVAMVIAINLPWHFLRVWMPLLLDNHHGFSSTAINYFSMAFYIAADAGCLGVGFYVRRLATLGWDVHRSRLVFFGICAGLMPLAGLACVLDGGPVLIILLLIVGAAGLALFPLYYTFSQDISGKRQGIVSGSLGCTTWIVTSVMQFVVGRYVDATGSFTAPLVVLSFAPLASFVLLLLVWRQWPPRRAV